MNTSVLLSTFLDVSFESQLLVHHANKSLDWIQTITSRTDPVKFVLELVFGAQCDGSFIEVEDVFQFVVVVFLYISLKKTKLQLNISFS